MMQKEAAIDVNAISWGELNTRLTEISDVTVLRKWLDDTMAKGGPKYRAVRIHGRLNAVRREQELETIKEHCA